MDNSNGNHPDEPAARTVHLQPASSFQIRPVKWVWEGRLAAGSLALLAGREGIGKSTVSLTLAADLTKGTLPGIHYGQPKSVMVAATEDSWEHTIVPRLMGAQADLDLVYRVDVVTLAGTHLELTLPTDVPGLRDRALEIDAAALVLDPLMSRLAANLDSHKDGEVRQALEPLTRLADSTNLLIMGLIHLNKTATTDALTGVMGSRAFVAVARAVLSAMVDPDDDQLRLLGQTKNNLGRADLPTLTYRVNGIKVADTLEGPVWTGKVEWCGETDRTINEALEASRDTPGGQAVQEAAEWLQDYLASRGGGAESAQTKAAGRAAGHNDRTLKRVLRQLGITAISSGFPRTTYWQLPADTKKPSTEAEGSFVLEERF